MNKEIDKVVRANLLALAKSADGQEELRKLGGERGRGITEIANAVEALIRGENSNDTLETVQYAYLEALLDSGPDNEITFDSGGCGGGDCTSFFVLPSGDTLVSSIDGWNEIYESLDEALDEFSKNFYCIENLSEFEGVPEDVGHVLFDGEIFYPDGDSWTTEEGMTRYAKYQGVWMDEDKVFDLENSSD